MKNTKIKEKELEQINEYDLKEIAKQIQDSFTSGILDQNDDNTRIIWELKMDKFII